MRPGCRADASEAIAEGASALSDAEVNTFHQQAVEARWRCHKDPVASFAATAAQMWRLAWALR